MAIVEATSSETPEPAFAVWKGHANTVPANDQFEIVPDLFSYIQENVTDPEECETLIARVRIMPANHEDRVRIVEFTDVDHHGEKMPGVLIIRRIV